MSSPVRLRLILLTCLLCTWALIAPSRAVDTPPTPAATSLDIGGRTVLIPSPPGFERSDGISAKWDAEIASGVAPSNRLLASFLSKEDAATLRSGKFPSPHRSFAVQVLKSYETKDVDDNSFLQMRDKLHQGLEKQVAQLAENLKNPADKDNLDAVFAISDKAVIGIFDETPRSLGFTLALNNHDTAPAAATEGKIIVAAMVAPVQERMLYLYAHAKYGSVEDRQWAEKSLITWRDAIFEANNPKPAVAESSADTSVAIAPGSIAAAGDINVKAFVIAGSLCIVVLAIALFFLIRALRKARSPKA